MIKRFWKNIFTVILAVAYLFTSVPIYAFASDLKEDYDSSSEFLSEDNFLRKYIVTLSENGTDNTITQELYAVDDSSILTEEFIVSNLNENYTLESLETVELSGTEINSLDKVNRDTEIRPFVVETIFDIGSLVISASEFYNNPSVWNGIQFVLDGASVVLPFVPSVTGTVRMIKASDKLQDSMEYGIKTFKQLGKSTKGTGLQRHHIVPKKFASLWGYAEDDMFCIALKNKDHIKITAKMNSAKYGLLGDVDDFTKSEVRRKMIRIYDDLFDETGDELYEFLSEFLSESRQYGID